MNHWNLGFVYLVLPIVAVIYYLIPTRCRSGYLAVISFLLLYGWQGNSSFLLLLNLVIDRFIVYQMWDKQHQNGKIKQLLTLSLAKNSCIAVISGVIIPIVFNIVPLIGGVVIPLTASYYHLRLSRGGLSTMEKPTSFFSHCLFFGKLQWGAIENPTTFIPQLACPKMDLQQINQGILLIIIALSQKVLLYDHLSRMANELSALPQDAITFAAVVLMMMVTGMKLFLIFHILSQMSRGIAAVFSFKLTGNSYYPLQAKGVYDYVYRLNMTFGRFLEELLLVGSWDRKADPISAKKRIFIIVTIALFAGVWLTPSFLVLVWAGLMGGLLWLQLKIPMRIYLYLSPWFFRVCTVAVTLPASLLISGLNPAQLGIWINALLMRSGLMNNQLTVIFNHNLGVFFFTLLCSSSLIHHICQKWLNKFPATYCIMSAVVAFGLLMITTSFMLLGIS